MVHQGNAEYLIRSVGWITGLRDVEQTVIARRGATPITVGNVATVQVGQAFRRSVLEKDGKEAVGGVVVMRVGENPLEVTRRIKAKIAAIGEGLRDQGVRIVPFYDRTPLIHQALETVGGTVREELIVCTLATLLVMGHLGNAFVVAITLPLAIGISFLLMRLFGLSSNIMSLAGISISVGILIDQAVVMGENAAHHLTRHFGRERIAGDITEIVIPACRAVGRPIFYSVVITILSFLPVFALTGREGKLFHPLAYTKTFALIGVALLSITLVPALIPIFLKGRIKSEDESWIIRTMTATFRPMLDWLMGRTLLVCWLFAVILGLGYLASTRLGREFMPDLDERTIMDMPTTVPRASIAQVAGDLRARDAILRGFPEVRQVVGKAGRAETPTDPSPLDMIETMINLRDRSAWPRRMLRFEDAAAQVARVLASLESDGLIRVPPADRQALIDEAAMTASGRVDDVLRDLASLRLAEFRPELGRALVGDAVDGLLAGVEKAAILRPITPVERAKLGDDLAKDYSDRLAGGVEPGDASALVGEVAARLVALGVLRDGPGLLDPPPAPIERAAGVAGEILGWERRDLAGRIADQLSEGHARRLAERVKALDWELFDRVATADEPADARGPVPIGRPIANVRAYVLDPAMSIVPVGLPGELFLGGEGVARGYLNDPGRTASAFVPDPFSDRPGARLYRTGDRARRRADGRLEFLGRVDGQVKVRGFRVEPGEIESALLGRPGVAQAAVVVRDDVAGGSLAAFVVARRGVRISGEALRRDLRERLPRHLVPATVVVLDALPMTRGGKVDRRALAVFERQSLETKVPKPPTDDVERRLIAVAEDVLNVRPIGPDDDFFDLGGHSLLAVRLLSRVEAGFGVRVGLADLVRGPTIENLARLVREPDGGLAWSPVVTLAEGEGAPLFLIHPVGGGVLCYAELARMLGDRAVFGLQARGLDGGGAPLDRVEDMAALYLEAVRTRQPSGPYHLAGWSMGGVVAFEMARRLCEQGEAVGSLVLIDSSRPGPGSAPADDAGMDAAFARNVKGVGADGGFETARIGQARDVFRSHCQALAWYEAQPYPGPLTLIRAGRGSNGWETLADDVRLHEIPGDHFSILRRPTLERVASVLAGTLNGGGR